MNFNKSLTPFIFGIIGIFSFAPFSIKPLIFFSYAYLIRELVYKNNSRLKKLFYWSLGHWGFGMSWLIVSVYYYGETSIYVSLLIFVLLVLLLSLAFSAPLLFISKLLIKTFERGGIVNLILISSALMLSEISMNYLLYGVPWLIAGATLLDTISQGVYPILGALGASFIIYFCSSLIASRSNSRSYTLLIYCLLPFIISFPKESSIINENNKDLAFSIIQPSTDPFQKYNQGYAEKIEDNIIELVEQSSKASKLLVLPEAELPYAYEDERFKRFQQKLPKNTIMGAWSFADGNLYNSIISTEGGPQYNKVHLVPFGEFIPFEKYLRGLISFFDMPMSSVHSGSKDQDLMYLDFINNISYSALICFDIAFSESVRKSNISSKFIINVSNDTWFGNSIGPYQHLHLARIRAHENNRWLIRAANDGFSAIINNKGTIVQYIEKGEKGVLNGSLQYIENRSFYSKYGYLFSYILSISALFFSIIINSWQRSDY
ncbi:apolipoprotein N-acyltransferase [Gammaproteobacteria bacterium]|nr:apolipoprotein N-acyltransferase [Gammaproteobacteria bacterium]